VIAMDGRRRPRSVETRAKTSEALKGRVLAPEVCRRHSVGMLKVWAERRRIERERTEALLASVRARR
jgi:hypothetical protein